jgi:ABC-type nitrate/sulfonate/bicarbonate transport system substrate-binding protein
MVRMMMQAHGLEYGRDYTFMPVGSGRLPYVLDGSAAGASAGSATAASEAAQNGDVHILARGPDYLPAYPSNPYATTRRWAVAHPDLLLSFIGAIIDTKEWLLNPANEQAAVQSIMRTDRVDEARARQLYRQAYTSIGDLSTEAQVREDMIQLVEDMRATVGLMDRPTPPPSKFVTSAWYDLALRLRGQSGGSSGLSIRSER